MVEKVVHWIIFNFLLSLFPIILTAMLVYHLFDRNLNLARLIEDGELYIINATLIAPFFGDLCFIDRSKFRFKPVFHIFVVGVLLFQLMVAVGMYAGTVIARSLDICYNVNKVTTNSIGLFIASVFTMLGSMIYKEGGMNDDL